MVRPRTIAETLEERNKELEGFIKFKANVNQLKGGNSASDSVAWKLFATLLEYLHGPPTRQTHGTDVPKEDSDTFMSATDEEMGRVFREMGLID